MTNKIKVFFSGCCVAGLTFVFLFCTDRSILEFDENSPTSGKLKVYYDEGLEPHVKNQAYTFEAQYSRATLDLHACPESEAVQALYNDSCESIVISRPLNASEKKAFASKTYTPSHTMVAKTGVALITNIETPLTVLSYDQLIALLLEGKAITDTTGKSLNVQVVFDQNNSAVVHYMLDSVLKSKQFSSSCSILNSTSETINYVGSHKNTVGIVNFAWLSDVDDSLYKANKTKIRFIGISQKGGSIYVLPDQSNFKLGLYPFTRAIYIIRKTGEFSLAKGFETFVASPKGQLTFLKQGLLPTRPPERMIQVKSDK